MPKFICPFCERDITARANRILGETSQYYMPYDLRVLCYCDKLVVFDLDWKIALVGAKAKNGTTEQQGKRQPQAQKGEGHHE